MHEVANNNFDFIVVDELKDEFIATKKDTDVNSGEVTMHQYNLPFDIEDLCKKDVKFRTNLSKTFKNIEELPKDDNFIDKSLKYIQDFMSSQMPWPENTVKYNGIEISSDVFREEFGFMEAAPFSFYVENKVCMCSERAAMAQYMLQQIGIKSYCATSLANISGVTSEPQPHSYVIFENKGQMFVYDPAIPRGDAPRILDTKMSKTIFDDFIDAVNYNKDGHTVDKKRVGFKCVDPKNGQIFIYCSQCGVKGQTTSPKKLKEARYGSSRNDIPKTL